MMDLLPDLDESTLRTIFLILFTLLCLSLFRLFRSWVNGPAKKIAPSWIRNQHVRSVDEAEFLFTQALEGLAPSLNLKLPADNEGASFQSYFSLLRLIMRHAKMAFLVADRTKSRLSHLKDGDQDPSYQEAVQRALQL